MNECPYCGNPVQPTWNFCRRCGARLIRDDEPFDISPPKEEVVEGGSRTTVNESTSIFEKPLEIEEEKEKEEKELSDDELIARIADVIIKREEYNSLLKRKKELNQEIDKLLERLKHKLIPRDEALPLIGKLKEEVKEVMGKLKEFENFSGILPLEEIIEDRNNERRKLKKLRSLKGDRTISKETYQEMESKYKKNIEQLTTKLNLELAKMKKTFDAIERKMKSLRRDLEILYVRYQTGEISEEEYKKQKEEKSKEIEEFKKVYDFVKRLLAEV